MPTTNQKKKTRRGKSGTAAAARPRSKRYGKLAGEKVEKAMHEMKRGKLRSGDSGKKVTDSKQAIAIGLSQARRAGGKVPRGDTSKRKKG